MQHRLGHTKKQQRNTVTGGEQHGEPGFEVILGLGMIRSELGIAPAAERYADDEDQKQCYGEHVKPAEAGGDIGQSVRKHLACQFRIADGTNHHQQDHDNGRQKHRD